MGVLVNNIEQLKQVLRKELHWAVDEENWKAVGMGHLFDAEAEAFIKLADEAIDSLKPTGTLTPQRVNVLTDEVFRKISEAFDYHSSTFEKYIENKYVKIEKFGTRNIRKDIQGQLRGLRIHLGNKYGI